MSRNLNDFPKEVLMLIFSFLHGKELARVGSVSKYFNQVHNQEFLWNSLYKRRFVNQNHSPTIRMEESAKYRFVKKYFIESSYRKQRMSKVQFPSTKQIFSIEPMKESEAHSMDFFVCTGECVHLYSYKNGGEKVVVDVFREEAEGVGDRKLVFDCAYLPKHNKMVNVGSSEYVELWDVGKVSLERKLNMIRKGIWSCEAFSEDMVCMSTSDGKVLVMDMENLSGEDENMSKILQFKPSRESELSHVAMFDCTGISRNPNLLISGSDHLYLWDIRNHEKTTKSSGSSIAYSVPEISMKFKTRIYELATYENTICCGLLNGHVKMYDIRKLAEDQKLAEYVISNEAIKGIQYDGDKLVVGTKNGWIALARDDGETLQFNTSWLHFKKPIVDHVGLIPVSGCSGTSVGCLYFNDVGCFVGENSKAGTLVVYDPFFHLKKEVSKCSIQ